MPANGFAEHRIGIFTPMDDLLYISQRGGPVKTLTKGFSDQRPWGRMMSANPGMDLEEVLPPLVGGDTLHEYPGWTSFLELVTEHDEGLSTSSDPPGFSPFRRENLLEEVGE